MTRLRFCWSSRIEMVAFRMYDILYDNLRSVKRRTSVWITIHEERPHQGLGNECIAPTIPLIGAGLGPIRCPEHLSGVLKFYYRAAM